MRSFLLVPQMPQSQARKRLDCGSIHRYIAASYTAPAEWAAARQLARSFQASLVVDLSNAAAIRVISTAISRATHCVFITLTGNNGSPHPALVATNIETVSMNTKTRLRKYLAYSNALDGTAMSSPAGNSCENIQ